MNKHVESGTKIQFIWMIGAYLAVMTAASPLFAGAYRDIGCGARAAAMGDAGTAVADDGCAVFWNPAGLVQVRGTALAFTRGQWIDKSTIDWASAGFHIGKTGAIGLGYSDFKTKEIARTVETSDGQYAGESGTAKAALQHLSAGYALGFPLAPQNLLLGLQAGSRKETAGDLTENKLVFDAGAILKTGDDRLALGLSAFGLGAETEGRAVYRAGVAGRTSVGTDKRMNLLLAADAVRGSTGEWRSGTGIEYAFTGASMTSFCVRGGWRFWDVAGNGGSWTLGGGVAQKWDRWEIALDYAFVPYDLLGDTHRFTLQMHMLPTLAKAPAAEVKPAVSTGLPQAAPLELPALEAPAPERASEPAPKPAVPKRNAEYDTHMERGDQQLQRSDFGKAAQEYKDAYNLKKTNEAYRRMQEATAELDYERAISTGQNHLYSGTREGYRMAIQAFEKALRYKETRKVREMLEEAQQNYKESSQR